MPGNTSRRPSALTGPLPDTHLAKPAAPPARQPLVILGGFLSSPPAYREMQQTLHELTGQAVEIVPAWSYDWAGSVLPAGWAHVLDKLDPVVRRTAAESETGRVTLIGHSAGGVMARLYFSICPFAGRVYRGLDYVDHLITLGSPHYNRRGSWMRRWVDRQYPGAHFAPAVRYSAVAGRGVRGDRRGSLRQRWAYRAYKQLAGEGDTWGDGLVPVSSALLDGALPVVLDGVTHHAAFGHPWYGSRDIVLLWWQASLGAEGVP